MNNQDVSVSAQRVRLKKALQERGSVTTYEARDGLNISSPAPRIFDLRAQGYDIKTILETLEDGNGNPHPKSARYVLVSANSIND
mgnify:CR=1 FL=1